MNIKRVAVVGGTHGNEWLGVWVTKKFQRQPELIYRSRFETVTLIGNPRAVQENRRYLDRDLNRCFDRQDLANPDLTGYENRLAKEIAAQIGAGGTQPVDGIFDLHTTTTTMGVTIIPISHSLANLRLAAHMINGHPNARIYMGLYSEQASPMLRSLAPLGCTIEVGPIAQGILDAKLFQQMEAMVLKGLDYFEYCYGEQTPTAAVTLYQAIETIDYPKNSHGEIAAMIHPDRQGQDYQPMAPGDPLFLDFNGQTIVYQGQQTVFPVFINEAAYYEKGIAAILTERREIAIG
jgi:succinylglutamate desuccinylase